MFKRLLAILFVLISLSASAQSAMTAVKDFDSDAYAYAPNIDLSKNLPALELRELAQSGDLEAGIIAADLLGYANTFIGTRYRRGGKRPGAFDCSGFTGYIFRQFGYSLSASSSAQYGDGEKVDRDDIQPGDLLFFKGRSSQSSRVGHVGIAVSADPETGEITFIHASISKGVTIDRVSEPYYAKRFVGARRVINAK